MNFNLEEIPEWWINKSVFQYTIEKSIPSQLNLTNKVAYLNPLINNTQDVQNFLENDVQSFIVTLKHGSMKEIKKFLVEIRKIFIEFESKHNSTLSEALPALISVGFEIRSRFTSIGRLENNEPIDLERNSSIMLSANKKCSYTGNLLYGVYVNCQSYIKYIHIGSYIRIDNTILLMVKNKSEDYLTCMVMIGGVLKSFSDVQFPYLPHRSLTPEEAEDFQFVFYENPDFICCRNVKDFDYYKFVKSIFIKEGCEMIPFYCAPYFAHESSAVRDICKAFDGIIVEEQSHHKELIAKECEELLKPTLIDLTSMVGDQELVVGNADSIIVDKKSLEMKKKYLVNPTTQDLVVDTKNMNLQEVFFNQVLSILNKNCVDGIVVYEGDIFVKKLSKLNFSVPIIFITDNAATAKQLLLFRGMKSMVLPEELCKLQDLKHLKLPFKTGHKILILSFCKSLKLFTVK